MDRNPGPEELPGNQRCFCIRHTGTPLSSRSLRVVSPFFSSAAMRNVFPLWLARPPLTSILSFCSIRKSCSSRNRDGPRWTGISPFSVFRTRGEEGPSVPLALVDLHHLAPDRFHGLGVVHLSRARGRRLPAGILRRKRGADDEADYRQKQERREQ